MDERRKSIETGLVIVQVWQDLRILYGSEKILIVVYLNISLLSSKTLFALGRKETRHIFYERG